MQDLAAWGNEAIYDDRVVAANVDVEARVALIRRMYVHLIGAIVGFIGLELLFFATPIHERVAEFALAPGCGFLNVFGAFLFVGWTASRFSSPGVITVAGITTLCTFAGLSESSSLPRRTFPSGAPA